MPHTYLARHELESVIITILLVSMNANVCISMTANLQKPEKLESGVSLTLLSVGRASACSASRFCKCKLIDVDCYPYA